MQEESSPAGIGLRTLAVASVASAVAAYLVPMIWAPGTIPAAAAMPVIVALISEALHRPAARVARAGQRVAGVRRDRGQSGPIPGVTVYRRRRSGRRAAVYTGLLAFAIIAIVWTVTELATGRAISGDQRTTFLPGSRADTPAKARDPKDAGTPDPGSGPSGSPRPGQAVPAPAATPVPTPVAPAAPAEADASPDPSAPAAPIPAPAQSPAGAPPANAEPAVPPAREAPAG